MLKKDGVISLSRFEELNGGYAVQQKVVKVVSLMIEKREAESKGE